MADIEMENATTEANSNGEPKVEAMDDSELVKQDVVKNQETNGSDSKYADNETFKMYLSKKLSKNTAEKLMEMCESLSLSTDDFDERAVELLASFLPDQALFILTQLEESKMYGVQNKPQYLMAVMKNFRDRVRTMGAQTATTLSLIPGPKPDDIKAIIDRTGYQLEVTVGQRKYHNPPPSNGGEAAEGGENLSSNVFESTGGCIYVGQIPRDTYEDALIPLFEEIGKIHDLRLMMDPVNGKSRGYAFLIYCEKEHAGVAAKKYDGFEIQPGKTLKVNVSVANTRLFLGNIPKSKSKEEILEELKKHAEGVVEVIVYANTEGGETRKNRGFCFVDFSDHKAASDAKRRISMGKVRPWNNDLVVDWAEQQDEPDEETMSTVKVLYVKNLPDDITEEKLKEIFDKHGEVERAKKIRDYAFIHFKERDHALAAIQILNGTFIDNIELDISLAKPQGDQKQKKKIALKRGGIGGPGGPGSRSRGSNNYGGGGYGGDYYGQSSGLRDRNGGYKGYPAAPPYGGGYPPAGPYDPYSGYGAPYYAGGYDPYGGYAPDPYYGASVYSSGSGVPGMRGGGGGRNQGGRPGGNRNGPPGGGRGGRGRGGGRGSKRPGADTGGPASKRSGGRPDDFASDVSMNMF